MVPEPPRLALALLLTSPLGPDRGHGLTARPAPLKARMRCYGQTAPLIPYHGHGQTVPVSDMRRAIGKRDIIEKRDV